MIEFIFGFIVGYILCALHAVLSMDEMSVDEFKSFKESAEEMRESYE